MGLQIKININHLIILLIFFLPIANTYSQENLKFGTTTIASKQIEIDKFDCKITPSFSISEEIPENVKLNFNMVWIDKKGNQVGHPDKITLFIKVDNNIEEYHISNGKKISTSPGLFGKKNIELTNSLSFIPAGSIEINQYRSVHFKDNMAPLSLKALNFTNSPITMNLVVYIGKEKGNSIEISEKGNILSWKIILPEVKPDEEVSCADLEKKYNLKFEENKPKFLLGYFETKLLELEYDPETTKDQLWKLNSELIQYKSNVNALNSLKEQITANPNYKKCDKLPQLIGSINSFAIDVTVIQKLIDRVNIAIKNNSGSSGSGGGEPPFEAFKANNTFCENTFKQLFNIKYDPDLLNYQEPNYLKNLYFKLKKLKVSQDSLYNIIVSSDDSPVYKRDYQNFNSNYNGSIATIEKLDPDIANAEQTDIEEDSPIISTKGRSFPYTWIIIPVLLILALFGGFKLFKYFKKAKSLNEKTK